MVLTGISSAVRARTTGVPPFSIFDHSFGPKAVWFSRKCHSKNFRTLRGVHTLAMDLRVVVMEDGELGMLIDKMFL